MIILTFLSLLGFCFSLTRFTRFDVEGAPFFVVSSLIVVLYFSAFMGVLPYGVDAIFLLGCGLFFLSSYDVYKNRKHLTSIYLTPGFFSWMIIYAFLAALTLTHKFTGWDEFAHWGPHTKIMYMRHGFELAKDYVMNKGYPPGSRLLHYYFFSYGGYAEGLAYLAQLLLTFAPLAIFFKPINKSSLALRVFFFLLSLLLLIYFHVGVVIKSTIYMDGISGLYWAGAFIWYLYSGRKWHDILCLLPIACSIILFKPELLPFVCLVAFLIALDQICLIRYGMSDTYIPGKKKFNSALISKLFYVFGSILLLVVAAWVVQWTWQLYLTSIHVPPDRPFTLTLNKLIQPFTTSRTKIQAVTIHHFLMALMQEKEFFFTLFASIAFTTVVFKKPRDKISWVVQQVGLTVGCAAYLFGLLILYFYAFGSYEGPNIASFYRYTSIYFLGWSLIVLYGFRMALRSRDLKKELGISAVGIVLCLVLLGLFLVNTYEHSVRRYTQHRTVKQLRASIDIITDKVKRLTPKDARIFNVWQASSGFESVIITYNLVPRTVSEQRASFGKKYTPYDVWTREFSPERFKEEISSYDYLLLSRPDSQFWATYKSLFDESHIPVLAEYELCMGNGFDAVRMDGCQLVKQHAFLFKIIKTSSGIRLQNVMRRSALS